MAYPFTPVPREVFKKTFLRDVLLCVSYTPIADTDAYVNGLAEFVSSHYNKKLDKDKFNGGIGLISEDNNRSIYFSSERTALRMRYPGYKSFDIILKNMSNITDYLKAFVVDAQLTVYIIKFNEMTYEFKRDTQLDIESAMRAVFSRELIGDVNIDREAVRWEKEIQFDDDETQTIMRLTYGYKKDDLNPNRGSLILKSSISFDVANATEITEERLSPLNELLDSAFHWCVNDDVIKNMRQG